MPAGCLYAPSEFILKNPGTCQALAHAVVHSLKWLQTAGPSDMIKTVPESHLLVTGDVPRSIQQDPRGHFHRRADAREGARTALGTGQLRT